MKFYTFDIFDTIITRTTATPHGIFVLMEEYLCGRANKKLFSASFLNNFSRIRVEAECTCRQKIINNDVQEITLDEIYALIQKKYCLSQKKVKLLKNLEIEYEINNVMPILANITYLESLLQENNKVAFISDMYLPSNVIKRMLAKAYPPFEKYSIPLYCSSDIKKTKGTGALFSYVAEKEHVKFKEWQHLGDNSHGDVHMPQSLGIKGIHYAFPQLTAFEKNILDLNPNSGYIQGSIGASRNSRFSLEMDVFKHMNTFGASYAGPMLFPYVDSLLRKALSKGKKRLYFVARDGFILKKIADVLIQVYQYSLSTNYIYGSRLSWRLANLHENNLDRLLFSDLIYSFDLPTFGAFSQFLGIDLEQLGSFLNLSKQLTADEKLTIDSYAYIQAILRENEDLRNAILKASQDRRSLLQRYLVENFDFSDNDFAFVELCGSGTTQDCLAEVLTEIIPGVRVTTFFFDLAATASQEKSEKLSFIKRSPDCQDDLLELLCRAPHGQTLGYAEQDGRVVPVLALEEGKSLEDWGYDFYIKAVLTYSRLFSAFLSKRSFIKNTYDLYKFYHCKIKYFPPKEVAYVLGSIPFSATAIQDNVHEYAPYISVIQALKGFFLKKTFPISWWQGTKARGTSSLAIWIIRTFPSGYKTVLDSLFSIEHQMSTLTINFMMFKISLTKLENKNG